MPALGKDLSKIRSHLGLSIQDIQHATKIPVTTLKSIEDGSIFSHPEENQTYIRSFVRSYGRALKIDDEVMIKALDQNEAGNYNHLLLQQFPALTPEEMESSGQRSEREPQIEDESETIGVVPGEESNDEKQQTAEDENITKSMAEIDETDVVEKATPQDDLKPKKRDTEPSVKSVDWADVGRKFSEEKKHTPVWVVGVIIILIIAAIAAYFLYTNNFFDLGDLSQQEQGPIDIEEETSPSNLSLDLEDSLSVSESAVNMSEANEPSASLGDTLQLTIYAAYDGLGPVRVWSDIKPRMDPYWIEQGTAMQFEFRDTIRVRGSYNDMLLFKNGNLIDNAAQNFFQQESDYIQLTRNFFESDEKWTTSVDYELPENTPPPDSIVNRPTF